MKTISRLNIYLLLLLTSTSIQAQIIADHTVVDKYSSIPDNWIDTVKKMYFNLPGESHSGAYRAGLNHLEALDSKFQVNVREYGTPETFTSDYLRASRLTYGDKANASGWVVGYGEEDWFTSNGSIVATLNHLDYCNTNGYDIDAFGFGWCWDMTWHNNPGGDIDPVHKVRWAGSSVGGDQGDLRWGLDSGDSSLTGNGVSLQKYIDATLTYMNHCKTNGYKTKVFFSTGPVDGYTNIGENGYQRFIKHEYIRDFVNSDTKYVLFDFADILSHNNDNELATATWTDGDDSLHTYPVIHDFCMTNFDGNPADPNAGYHFGEEGALRLGKAIWWMLARMAGWDGGTPGGEDNDPPTAPAGTEASAISDTEIRFTWDSATDNTGVVDYIVFIDSVNTDTVLSLSYIATGLTPDTEYSFQVSARDAAGNVSGLSIAVNATTLTAPDSVAPTAPANLTTSYVSSTEISLDWEASIDNVEVVSYLIYRNNNLIDSTHNLTYMNSGLNAETEYGFKVAAKDYAGNISNYSNIVTAVTLSIPDTSCPSRPSNLRAETLTQTSIKIAWDSSVDNVGIKYYCIYRNGTCIDSVSTNTFSDIGLIPNTVYAYTIIAADSSNNLSEESEPLAITTAQSNTNLKLQDNFSLTISPNPSEGLICLTGQLISNNSTLLVYAENGVLLKTITIRGINLESNGCTLDLDLPTGTYILSFVSNQRKTGQIIQIIK